MADWIIWQKKGENLVSYPFLWDKPLGIFFYCMDTCSEEEIWYSMSIIKRPFFFKHSIALFDDLGRDQ